MTAAAFAASAVGSGQTDRAVRVDDLEDRRPRHQLAAVGDRPVGADQVDRVDLERPDAHRDTGTVPAGSCMPKSLAPVEEVVEAR